MQWRRKLAIHQTLLTDTGDVPYSFKCLIHFVYYSLLRSRACFQLCLRHTNIKNSSLVVWIARSYVEFMWIFYEVSAALCVQTASVLKFCESQKQPRKVSFSNAVFRHENIKTFWSNFNELYFNKFPSFFDNNESTKAIISLQETNSFSIKNLAKTLPTLWIDFKPQNTVLKWSKWNCKSIWKNSSVSWIQTL